MRVSLLQYAFRTTFFHTLLLNIQKAASFVIFHKEAYAKHRSFSILFPDPSTPTLSR